ncbi:MAG: hypothetical protein K2X28_08000 [Alphaproteobacteria bacterium]|nr:hypothetical protein [Alphaproteobacteria bacterium]
MTNFKHQGLAKAILCLSMLLNAGSINADPLDLEGPNLIGPRRPSRPKQDWENKKPEEQREIYIARHNAMAVKYGHTEHIIDHQASHRGISLTKAAEDFKNESIELNLKLEEEGAEIDSLGQVVVHTSKTVAKTLVETNVEREETKNVLTQFIDRCGAFVESFFK